MHYIPIIIAVMELSPGDLNMGNNDINNAKNITASGTGNLEVMLIQEAM